jgi:hypothetical protein
MISQPYSDADKLRDKIETFRTELAGDNEINTGK